MADDAPVPNAISESTFTLIGVTVRCYVLSDGRRVVNVDDFNALMGALGGIGGMPYLNDEDRRQAERFDRWKRGE